MWERDASRIYLKEHAQLTETLRQKILEQAIQQGAPMAVGTEEEEKEETE